MPTTIRPASIDDVPAMVALSDRERTEREKFDPQFFRKAAGAAEAQSRYFKWQLQQANIIALVNERDGIVDGFAIATLINAPPVYDPDGLTALIDDFTVARPEL